MVALPAVGALFVAHLARQDWRRMQQESGPGAGPARYSFAAAFALDTLDVAAHLVGGAGPACLHCAGALPAKRAAPPACTCTLALVSRHCRGAIAVALQVLGTRWQSVVRGTRAGVEGSQPIRLTGPQAQWIACY
jgi:hypothetical protein